ncbi:MAG TPA: SDR family oxidoreductase, partial [Anaerolineales bacterium]|nr:SDR family oxidoreductase [Anaerolineales bacterium]
VLLHLVGGWSGGRTIEELQAGDIEAMLRQHLWTSVHLAQALVPHMRAAGWGRFLVISSPAASQPVARRAPYAIGKAAQEALVLTMAQELKGSGVTANAVLVSTIDVAGERKRKPDAANLGWATPEEITATLLHLCSDQAGTINGARIPLHGG